MTTVSRTSQVTHSNVTGGGDWDHRLNRLLEDLQGTVVPPETRTDGTEYREYRMTSSTRNNEDPPLTTDEKWVEYGTRGDAVPSYHTHLRDQPHGHGHVNTSSSSMSSSSRTCQEKSIGFTGTGGRSYGIDSGLRTTDVTSSAGKGRGTTQIEYLTPANSTTVMKSGSASPAPPTMTTTTSLLPSSSPKVERKEFYAKASYTTLIKGGADGQPLPPLDRDMSMDKFVEFPQLGPPGPSGLTSTKSSSESRREYSRTTERHDSPGPRMLEPLEPPMFTSTPLHQTSSSYSSSRVTNTLDGQGRSATPPPRPVDGLKTPPLIRKVMQQSQSSYSKEVSSSTGRGPGPITYIDDTPKSPQYFTSTTTRTETRERESSPARRFPSPQPPKPTYGEPPKRLDELLATFDESYTETSKIGGDGGGPWKSTPYGPGTQAIRTVRIDDNVQTRSHETDSGMVQRKPTALVESRNVSGPPVFYPPGQIFDKTEQQALMASRDAEKGKAKMKMDRKYKAGEKSKSSHSESGGQGAAPVPVCLPICCAAPCVIM